MTINFFRPKILLIPISLHLIWILDPALLRDQKDLDLKFFRPKLFLNQNVSDFLGPKTLLESNYILTLIFLDSNWIHFFNQKSFDPKLFDLKLLTQLFLHRKFVRTKVIWIKNVFSSKFFWTNIFLTKTFWIQNLFDPHVFGSRPNFFFGSNVFFHQKFFWPYTPEPRRGGDKWGLHMIMMYLLKILF